MLRLLLAVLAFSLASAHLCLISPPQRGTMNGLNKAGSDDCDLEGGPCGGRPGVRQPDIVLRMGRPYMVTFQKNLDHWNKTNPGYFSVKIGTEGGSLTELGRVADAGEPSLHLYSLNVTVQHNEPGALILQTSYVPNNSQAPPAFFQCADVLAV